MGKESGRLPERREKFLKEGLYMAYEDDITMPSERRGLL